MGNGTCKSIFHIFWSYGHIYAKELIPRARESFPPVFFILIVCFVETVLLSLKEMKALALRIEWERLGECLNMLL